ncbi:MAG TPA: twin-arginine translocase TatA/TatE family subunit [Marinilabiliales bacterium]|jgi:sec-independent protein translocase protein TatA|nr:MAG: preprotein translocase subunit TatA [Bacteroidetes bacterium GWA2_40_14]OFX58178.1 MAG: preprotein translocase subunit TatA [Bacteroidetes bacterium GWC2_40_13]OFX74971.1 MAG: preprotein translocase subunit TatA [Bacteroidetes bacterium GWD2_40_43]OFX95109.1 MAG: preprotein translocase subunit TatA [Bacteroidetes bacterium GWE2_40_63]OFY18969.1 MAG: preprotein translocase subunit TatA [Bacteroidetes bacterium GWF2_40_13]OFZ30927.1 MAG: preprotein translocase subunit TatA [Bacteroidetes
MEATVFMGIIGGQEILLIALVVILLFGGRKIPELMRGLGKGISEFKKASKGEYDDEKEKDKKE